VNRISKTANASRIGRVSVLVPIGITEYRPRKLFEIGQ
jgi:hypothetical protein